MIVACKGRRFSHSEVEELVKSLWKKKKKLRTNYQEFLKGQITYYTLPKIEYKQVKLSDVCADTKTIQISWGPRKLSNQSGYVGTECTENVWEYWQGSYYRDIMRWILTNKNNISAFCMNCCVLSFRWKRQVFRDSGFCVSSFPEGVLESLSIIYAIYEIKLTKSCWQLLDYLF